jgi:hypothetical protein
LRSQADDGPKVASQAGACFEADVIEQLVGLKLAYLSRLLSRQRPERSAVCRSVDAVVLNFMDEEHSDFCKMPPSDFESTSAKYLQMKEVKSA